MKRLLALAAVFTVVLAACGGGVSDGPATTAGSQGDAVTGEALFVTCSVCHGADATGLVGLGRDLTNSAFLAERTDAEMVEFLKTGRPADHPENTTGISMPPRGGDDSFTDVDLHDIVAFLRTLPGN